MPALRLVALEDRADERGLHRFEDVGHSRRDDHVVVEKQHLVVSLQVVVKSRKFEEARSRLEPA